MPEAVHALGVLAGILTTSAFVPQVMKLWRTRSAEDVSALMFAVMSLGVALWLLYGLLLGLWPVILANGVTLLLAVSILWLKLRFRGARASAQGGRAPAGDARGTGGLP